MQPKIIAKDKEHLLKLIKEEMEVEGEFCDLNHIDVSQITDMTGLFKKSYFNGNISKWDVSNVEYMCSMFEDSYFNGNISEWNVSNVKNMSFMFYDSHFNINVSKWDVSKVEDMHRMFSNSDFTGDVSNWKPYSLKSTIGIFLGCPKNSWPYWQSYRNKDERNKAIETYHLNKELNEELIQNVSNGKKIKI